MDTLPTQTLTLILDFNFETICFWKWIKYLLKSETNFTRFQTRIFVFQISLSMMKPLLFDCFSSTLSFFFVSIEEGSLLMSLLLKIALFLCESSIQRFSCRFWTTLQRVLVKQNEKKCLQMKIFKRFSKMNDNNLSSINVISVVEEYSTTNCVTTTWWRCSISQSERQTKSNNLVLFNKFSSRSTLRMSRRFDRFLQSGMSYHRQTHTRSTNFKFFLLCCSYSAESGSRE